MHSKLVTLKKDCILFCERVRWYETTNYSGEKKACVRLLANLEFKKCAFEAVGV